MIKFRNLYFPDNERILPEHMALEGNRLYKGRGSYQLHKLEKCFPYIKAFNHAVDVGANVGTWMHVLADKFKEVDCFEPVAAYRECLEANIPEGTNVHIHACGLGAEESELQFRVSRESSGWTHAMPTDKQGAAFLEKLHTKQYGKQFDFEFVTAQIKTLDSFDLPKIDFMKIDVEGFEYNVIHGGAKTILRDKPTIIVEQKPGTPDRYGLKPKGAVDLLHKWGATLAFEWSGDFCLYWK